MPVIDYLTDPLQYEFMQRALIEVILMGAVTGAIGAYIVLRGLSFIGDALSHAIFPGIVIAFLLGQSIFFGALIFGVLTSIAIAVVATNRRVKEDSAIGVLFAGTFALGHRADQLVEELHARPGVVPVRQRARRDDERHLALGDRRAIVIVLIVLFYRELLITSFDRAAAQAMGLPVFWLDLLLLVMISLTIVVSLRAVGNILVVAMLVTPAATARLLTDRLPVMIVLELGDRRRSAASSGCSSRTTTTSRPAARSCWSRRRSSGWPGCSRRATGCSRPSSPGVEGPGLPGTAGGSRADGR